MTESRVKIQTEPEFRADNRPFDPGIRPFERAFTDDIVGVVLRAEPREGAANLHWSFELIVEDDGNWFVYHGGNTDRYWMPNYIRVLKAARSWLQENKGA